MPPKLTAVLAIGLPENSRIKREISGLKRPLEVMLLASVLDALNILIWFKTKDGAKGVNRPESVAKKLSEDHSEQEEYEAYDSIEAYEAARKERIQNG